MNSPRVLVEVIGSEGPVHEAPVDLTPYLWADPGLVERMRSASEEELLGIAREVASSPVGAAVLQVDADDESILVDLPRAWQEYLEACREQDRVPLTEAGLPHEWDAVLEVVRASAEARSREASRLLGLVEAGWPREPSPLEYRRTESFVSETRHDVSIPMNRLAEDRVYVRGRRDPLPHLVAQQWAQSQDWRDRMRLAGLLVELKGSVRMPEGFPAVVGSRPRHDGSRQDTVWIAHPDVQVLEAALPLWRDAWDAYEAQWPGSPGSTWRVELRDDVAPGYVCFEDVAWQDIIADLLVRHPDIAARAPEHVARHHPRRRPKA